MAEKTPSQPDHGNSRGTVPLGFWWIATGIVLLIIGIAIVLSVLPRLLDGSIIQSSDNRRHAEIFFIGPLLPGLFAIAYGVDMRRKAGLPYIPFIFPGIAGNEKKESAGEGAAGFSTPAVDTGNNEPVYRDPTTAAICSLFIPGLGQAYNGRADLGLLLAFLAGGGLFLGLFPGIVLWACAIWEAPRTANRINRGESPYSPFQPVMALFIAMIFIPCLVLTLFLFSHYGPAVALALNFSTMRGP